MTATATVLKEQDISYIKAHLGEWLRESTPEFSTSPASIYDLELRERMLRVEEELKAQRELIHLNIQQMDRRFEDQKSYMDKRFEQIDKRFEDQKSYMDKRFEQIDKRFEILEKKIDRQLYLTISLYISSVGFILAAFKFF